MLPEEASVKLTFNGAVPVVGLALKPATGELVNIRTGAATLMYLVLVMLFDPPLPVTVRLTE